MPFDSNLDDIMSLAMDSRYLWMPSSAGTFATVRVLLHLFWDTKGLEQAFGHCELALITGMRPKDINDALGYMRSARMITRTGKGRVYIGSPGLFVNWLLSHMISLRPPMASQTPPDTGETSLSCPRCQTVYSQDTFEALVTAQGTLNCLRCDIEVIDTILPKYHSVNPFPIVDRFIGRCVAIVQTRSVGERLSNTDEVTLPRKIESTIEFVSDFDEPVSTKTPITWI